MQNLGQRNGDSANSPMDAMIVVILALRTWATSLEVFLRRDFGSRYFGIQAALAFVWVPLFWTVCGGEDLRPMIGFLVAYVAMCLLNRLQGAQRRKRRDAEHSFYTGRPLLWKLVPWASEIAVKKFVEPLFCLVAGILLCVYDAPLGLYVAFGAFAVMGSVMASEEEERLRAIDMNDAVIEQQSVAERFRDLRGDRF